MGWGLGVGVGALPPVERRSKVGAEGPQPPWGVCRGEGGGNGGGPQRPWDVFGDGEAVMGDPKPHGVSLGGQRQCWGTPTPMGGQ